MHGPPAELTRGGRTAGQIRAWLVAELARELQIAEHSINTAAPLHESGADSVTALKLTGALADWLQRDVPVTLVWDYQSIDAIAEALAESASDTP